MRSIYAKILLWSLATFAASLGAFAVVSYQVATGAEGPGDFFFRTLSMLEDDACEAYTRGGASGLRQTLEKLDRHYSVQHFLTDAQGKDLLSGEDRSLWLENVGRRPRRIAGPGGWHVIVRKPKDDRYRLMVLVHPRFDPAGILPYFGAIVLAIALLGYALAVHLASPLRTLRLVVDRFGRGDLSARARSRRKDEIGELSRAFDAMAGQIAILRQAERRLLQDVSHELRSPLARIGFNLELARINESEDREVALGRISRDFARLSALVDELLQLTVAEGDPTARAREEVRLDEMLTSLAEDCAVEAAARGGSIDLRIEGPTPLIGDRELLRRAIENVLRNAIRHAPDNSTIEVDLTLDGEGATLTVSDHGPGVPASALDLIFEPFFGSKAIEAGSVGAWAWASRSPDARSSCTGGESPPATSGRGFRSPSRSLRQRLPTTRSL